MQYDQLMRQVPLVTFHYGIGYCEPPDYRTDGKIYTFRTRPTNRRWQPLTANASHLMALHNCIPRFDRTTSGYNKQGIYTAKQWKRMTRKGIITDVFALHVYRSDLVLAVNFIRTIEQKKRDIIEQRRQNPHLESTPTATDVLRHVPQDHFLRRVLETYRHTLSHGRTECHRTRGE